VKRQQRVGRGGKVARLRASAEEELELFTAGRAVLERLREELFDEFGRRTAKKRITLYLDADVLAWFRAQGPRYQRRINGALRKVMREERGKSSVR